MNGFKTTINLWYIYIMECYSTIKNNELLEVGTLHTLRALVFSHLPCAAVGDSESQEEVIWDIARQLVQVADRMECGVRPGLVGNLAAQFMNGSLSEEDRRIYLFNRYKGLVNAR